MKEQDSQEQGSLISGLIANLLRDRLASKLPESDLTTLISETKEIVDKINQTQKSTKAASSSLETQLEAQSVPQINKLKDSIDYIEHKCREIERSLRESDRHVRPRERRERVFRDRSPLGIPTVFTRRSHNPWFDSYC